MAYLCKSGFEHHVAMTMGSVSAALDEAFTTYMGGRITNIPNLIRKSALSTNWTKRDFLRFL